MKKHFAADPNANAADPKKATYTDSIYPTKGPITLNTRTSSDTKEKPKKYYYVHLGTSYLKAFYTGFD